MNYIMMRFKVVDFDRWMAEFKADESWRQTSGEQNYRIFRDADDPMMITLLLGWDGMDSEQLFINSPKLHRRLQDGGVIGDPDYLLLKEL